MPFTLKSELWSQPGAEDRLRMLWLNRRSKNEIARILTLEFGVPISAHGVGGKVTRMALTGQGGSVRANPSSDPERVAVISLPAGYVYAAGRLLPPSENPECTR